MTLTHAEDCPVFELPGIRFTALLSPRTGSEDNAVWRFSMAAGTPGSVHRLTRQEIIHALSGSAVATIDGRWQVLQEGDTLAVPAMAAFSLANETAEAFEAIAILPKGGQAIIDGQQPLTPPWAS